MQRMAAGVQAGAGRRGAEAGTCGAAGGSGRWGGCWSTMSITSTSTHILRCTSVQDVTGRKRKPTHHVRVCCCTKTPFLLRCYNNHQSSANPPVCRT